MTKKKTSRKQEFFFKNMPTVKVRKGSALKSFTAVQRMKSKKRISEALWECLVANDTESFKEILKTHLELTNKDEFAKEVGVSRRTLYRMLSEDGNPTLDNVSKIIHKLCA